MIIDKVPSHDINAEQSLIASLLINNENFYHLDNLQPEHFYRSAHQKIYKAIKTLLIKNEPADLVTVTRFLKEKSQLEEIGGPGYLPSLCDNAPLALNPKQYGDIITGCAIVRNACLKLLPVIDKGFGNPNPTEFISDLQRIALNLEEAEKDNILSGHDIAMRSIERIEAALKTPDSDGMKTGFMKIDEIVNISGSKLILIAARPKVGKTAFMTSIIRNMCDFGYTVGCLSLEMDEAEITNRWVGELSDVNPMRFKYSGKLSTHEIRRIHDAHNQIDSWKIYIEDHGGSIDDIERKCRKMKKLGCQTIFIDQLSKIGGKGSAFEVYSENTSRIAMLKKELRIPIWLLCQINREGTERPTMRNLKQTGMLEEDADMIFILHREQNEIEKTACTLAAHRQGGCQDFELYFNPNRITFNTVS